MRTVLGSLALAGGLLAGACGSAAAPAAAVRCPARGAAVLAASPQAVLERSGTALIGCLRSGRRSARLGTFQTRPGVHVAGPYAAAGSSVAFVEANFFGDGTGATVKVWNLGPYTSNSAQAVSLGLPESTVSVGRLVLGGGGAAAWTGSTASILSRRSQREVDRMDSHGRVTVLDRGAGIDLGSLALRGSRLSWRDGGRPRRAAL